MNIKIAENGPILIEADGTLVVTAGDARIEKPGRVALCRCGQSSNKPLCDGTHKTCGFEAVAVEVTLQE